MINRTARQCRERYRSYIAPNLSYSPWTKKEDELLRAKYLEIGPKWTQMAHFFVGRSDVTLKNRWAFIGGLNRCTSVPVSASALPHPE
jgi:hypothetical protein